MATTLAALETIVRDRLKEAASMAAPSAPTVTPQGTTGATTYTYKVVALNRTGATEASSAGTTTTGNATLSSSNFNRITWTAVTNATAYQVYRTVGGATTGLVATVGAVLVLDDTGLTGDTLTAPTVNTAGGNFWSSSELVSIMNLGFKDLWGMIVDLNQEHYITVDDTNVTLAASGTSLTGVPADCFRVHLIEPKTLTSGTTGADVMFVPRDYNSADFSNARRLSGNQDPSGITVCYCLTQAGAPVGAPTVLTAPPISSTLALRFVYVPTIAAKTASDSNPIPGESDNAVVTWTVAWARAKEREDRSPDPAWLTMYKTEKQNLQVRLTPRQTQEPDVVEDLFSAFL